VHHNPANIVYYAASLKIDNTDYCNRYYHSVWSVCLSHLCI